jgi:hypothetical protein
MQELENIMKTTDLDPIFQTLIPIAEWRLLKKISLKFTDRTVMKWISFGYKSLYRRYYLKLTFKNQLIKKVTISKATKDQIMPKIKSFNQYLKELE